jgi:hypothetical protein
MMRRQWGATSFDSQPAALSTLLQVGFAHIHPGPLSGSGALGLMAPRFARPTERQGVRCGQRPPSLAFTTVRPSSPSRASQGIEIVAQSTNSMARVPLGLKSPSLSKDRVPTKSVSVTPATVKSFVDSAVE